MKLKEDPAVRATIRHFADRIRTAGISPSMREIEVSIAVELLREQHGIKVAAERLRRTIRRD